jgi:uncharacterized SAM-binding protein YcdF (DUF218 family)
MSRLVAVLGYSDRPAAELHPVCAARLARAELETTPDDVVLFSGWARNGRAAAEADLMASSWTSRTHARIVDRSARTTLGNAIGIGRAARRYEVDEVVLVTSRWHARRAAVLVRAALGGTKIPLRVASTDEPAPPGRGLRELVSWTIVPFLVLVAARTR